MQKKNDFRRWYERQLYEAFSWLAVCLLGGVLFATILEFVGFDTPGLTPYLTMFVLYLIGIGCVETFRRFWSILSFANHCADKATCTQCDGYGLFSVQLDQGRIPAICRKCGHRWEIS